MKNAHGDDLRICTKCQIRHYENCTTCFGFGLKKHVGHPEQNVLVRAAEAHDGFCGEVVVCPECGSGPQGTGRKEGN